MLETTVRSAGATTVMAKVALALGSSMQGNCRG
jgi:hypothetical protein